MSPQPVPPTPLVDEPPAYCECCDVDDGTTRSRGELPLGSTLCDRCMDRLLADVEGDRLDALTRPTEVVELARAGRAAVDWQRRRRTGTLPAKHTAALGRAVAAGDPAAVGLADFLEAAAAQADDFGRLPSLPRLLAAYSSAAGCGVRTAQRRRQAAVEAGWLVHARRGHLGARAIYLLAVPRRWRWRSPDRRHLTSITCTSESTKSALSPATPDTIKNAPGTGPSVAGNSATTPRAGQTAWMGTQARSRAAQTLLSVPEQARAQLSRAEKLALLTLVDHAIAHAGPYAVAQGLRGHLVDARDVAAVLRWRLRRLIIDNPTERPPPRPPRPVDGTGQRWAAAQLGPEAIAANRRGAAAGRAQLAAARTRRLTRPAHPNPTTQPKPAKPARQQPPATPPAPPAE